MREILFRGKRKDNGEWVYGDLIHNGVDENNGLVEYKDGDEFICMVDIQDKLCIIRKVKADTVGQYVNFIDKNGVKVFEGDIVKIMCGGMEYIAQIVWDNFEHAFIARNKSGVYGSSFEYLRKSHLVKVIGNVYDNPHLMEVQDGEN